MRATIIVVRRPNPVVADSIVIPFMVVSVYQNMGIPIIHEAIRTKSVRREITVSLRTSSKRRFN